MYMCMRGTMVGTVIPYTSFHLIQQLYEGGTLIIFILTDEKSKASFLSVTQNPEAIKKSVHRKTEQFLYGEKGINTKDK